MQGGLQDVRKRSPIGIAHCLQRRRRQSQRTEESDISCHRHRRRKQHLLRIGDDGLHLGRLPLHLCRQRRHHAQDPQHIAFMAHPPQPRTQLDAGGHQRLQVLDRACVGYGVARPHRVTGGLRERSRRQHPTPDTQTPCGFSHLPGHCLPRWKWRHQPLALGKCGLRIIPAGAPPLERFSPDREIARNQKAHASLHGPLDICKLGRDGRI